MGEDDHGRARVSILYMSLMRPIVLNYWSQEDVAMFVSPAFGTMSERVSLILIRLSGRGLSFSGSSLLSS